MRNPIEDAPAQVKPNQAPANPLYSLLDLSRRARRASSAAELRFMAVNDGHVLAPFRQSGLWLSGLGLQALSGVVQVEANAPYALWLDKVCLHLSTQGTASVQLTANELPPELAVEWLDWLPEHALWLPLEGVPQVQVPHGGLLLARDTPWQEQDVALLAEWMDNWRMAWRAQFRAPAFSLKLWRQRVAKYLRPPEGVRWWKHKPLQWLLASSLVLFFPVKLTVLAPGELVPASPAVMRAPLDGVVDVFHVQPNQTVKQGDPLFSFDEALIESKLEVARQALATSEAEYRQMIQLALLDPKSRAQLSTITGKIEEKRAEALYIEDQLKRSRVLAPRDGVALFDDPSEWLGKPVTVGERIMRIAAPQDVEVEAWVPVADAIPLRDQAEVSLFLSASPLSPAQARVRYFSHDAVQRPDGAFAYRLRATLDESTQHRVGLKGTAKIHGQRVPLIYWVMRRPWAWVRSVVGW